MWFVNLLPNLNMYNTSVGALKFEKAYKTLTSPATTQGAVHLTVGLLPVVSGCQLWAAERIRELPLLDLRWRRWEICFGFFPKHLRENDAKVLLRMESEVNIAGGGGCWVFFSSFWNRIEGNSLSQEYGLVGWFKPCKLFSKARLPHWAMTGCRISKLIWHLSRLSAGQLWHSFLKKVRYIRLVPGAPSHSSDSFFIFSHFSLLVARVRWQMLEQSVGPI